MFSFYGDLASLLYPIAVDDFIKTYWGKKPLFISRQNDDYYKGLYTSEDMDDCIRFMAPADGWNEKIRMAIKFKQVSAEALLDRNRPGFDYQMIRRSQKAVSLIMNFIQDHNNRVYRMARLLEKDLQNLIKGRVNVNAYFSPGNTYINPHVDSHDELNIQVEGKKRWRIYEPRFTNPCTGMPLDTGFVQETRSHYLDGRKPYMEITMHPGDFLYMPRGFWHDPVNVDDEPSLGLTIGVHPICWLDLVGFAVKAAGENHRNLRGSIPAKLSSDSHTAPSIKEMVRSWMAMIDQSASVDEMTAILQRDHPVDSKVPDSLYVPPHEALSALTPLSPLRRPKESDWSFQQIYGLLKLKVYGREIGLRLELKESLEFIRDGGETFTPSELPGDLTLEEKTHLCRFLLNFGLIRFNMGDAASPVDRFEQPEYA